VSDLNHPDLEALGVVADFALGMAQVLLKLRAAHDSAVDLHLTSDEVRTLMQVINLLREKP
jgi:hypothetical protein